MNTTHRWHRWLFLTLSALVPLASSAGCNERCSAVDCSGGGRQGGTLVIEPSSVTLDVTSNPVSQQFKAFLISEGMGGTTKVEVTKDCNWSVGLDDQDNLVGKVSDEGLFSTIGPPLDHAGNIKVHAQVKGNDPRNYEATVTINYRPPPIIDASAVSGEDRCFDQPNSDPSLPLVLYPLDGAMYPRNIHSPAFQWTDAPDHTLWRIHATGAYMDLTVYGSNTPATCATKMDEMGNIIERDCHYELPAKVWRQLAYTESKAESSKGGAASIEICTAVTCGSPLACSQFRVNFSPQDVRGFLYYFSPEVRGLERTAPESEAAKLFSPKGGRDPRDPRGLNTYDCGGCHTISSDGKRIALTVQGSDGVGGILTGNPPLNATAAQEWSAAPYGSTGGVKRWNFATFSPDGKHLLTDWAGVLTLRDGATGAKSHDIPLKSVCPNAPTDCKGAIMPEWSPDGATVAFVQIPPEGVLGRDFKLSSLVAGDWVAGNTGNIAVMRWTGDDAEAPTDFAPAQVLVPSTPTQEYHYFPSWSPDSRWLAFVSSRLEGGSSPTAGANIYGRDLLPLDGYVLDYDWNQTRLRLVSASGGTPVDLSAATHAMGMTTSWPKFSPFQQASLVFFTFGAKFDYGTTVVGGKTTQLWMAGLDLSRLDTPGVDPSYPPIWWPSQDKDQNNHAGIWTQEITCDQPSDCPAAYTCDQNHNCVKICGESGTPCGGP